MIKHFTGLLLVGGLLTLGANANAAPVEYVRVCSLYGAGFSYVPGTDVCFNVYTGETRQQTEGGTWFGLAQNAPVQWVPNAAAGCLGGTLVDLGTLDRSSFAPNGFGKFETAGVSLTLGQGDFISNIMIHGGFTRISTAAGVVRFTGSEGAEIPGGTALTRQDGLRYLTGYTGTVGMSGEVDVDAFGEFGGSGYLTPAGTELELVTPIVGVTGNAFTQSGFDLVYPLGKTDLCLAFYDLLSMQYSLLGCEDVAALNEQVATLSFAPRRSSPPASFVGQATIVAHERDWRAVNTVMGSVSLSACVRNTSADGSACTVAPSADPNVVTITCGATSAPLAGIQGAAGMKGANGATGMNGNNGADGPNGGSASACSITDHGDGSATMACPDGTSAELLTTASLSKAKAAGCSSGDSGVAPWFLAALLMLVRRALQARKLAQSQSSR